MHLYLSREVIELQPLSDENDGHHYYGNEEQGHHWDGHTQDDGQRVLRGVVRNYRDKRKTMTLEMDSERE